MDLMSMYSSMGIVAKCVAVILLIMSMWSIGVGIERFFTYQQARTQSKLYAPQVAKHLKEGRLKDAVALSLGLQHHVPLGELIRPGLDQFFVPNGHTDDPEIPRVRSAVDYIARRLAIDWLPYAVRAELGVYTLTERVHRASTWITACELAARRSAPPAPRGGWR